MFEREVGGLFGCPKKGFIFKKPSADEKSSTMKCSLCVPLANQVWKSTHSFC